MVSNAAAVAVDEAAGVAAPLPPPPSSPPPAAGGVKVVVCDIEGTTTSISFVKDVLFVYARQHVRTHLTNTWSDAATQSVVQLLRTEAEADVAAQLSGAIPVPPADADREAIIDALVRIVEWQMDANRKAAPLKTLQGQIWALAYESGSFKGHVYADVPAAFDAWRTAGARICIYSSGSVAAQKQLFGHSEHGDLLSRFSGHYDTKVGAKLVAASYTAICADLAVPASQVLFLTDVVAEAKAAREAGLRAVIVERPGNAPLTEADRLEFAVVQTLTDVSLAEDSTSNPSASSISLKRKLDADAEPTGVELSEKAAPTDVAVAEDVEVNTVPNDKR